MVDLPFGQIMTAGAVRNALRATLAEYLPDVLAVVAERAGFDPDVVLPPRGYGASADPEDVGDQPLGVIVAPGMSGQPVHRGNGLYELPWDAAVAIVVSAPTRDQGQALSEVYGAAVRAAIMQHPSLGGLAVSTRWVDERHEEIAFSSGRSVWAPQLVFAITVSAAVDGYATAGPNPIVEQHIEVFNAGVTT